MKILLIFAVFVFLLFFFRFGKRLVMLLFLRIAARGALKDVGQRAVDKQPDAIHLVEKNHAWENETAIRSLLSPIQTSGFQDAGQYEIQEMPQLVLQFLIKPDESIAAAVYEHQKAGTWIDLFTHYLDGSSFTITSLRDRGLEKRRQKQIVHAPGLNSGTLYRRFVKERPTSAMKPVTAQSVVKMFEDAYAPDIAWRRGKPITAEEVARVIQTSVDPKIHVNVKLK